MRSWPKLDRKPIGFNQTSLILWGNLIVDWEWAIQTLIWKQYHDSLATV
jgi:hypothetical protein